MECLLCCANSSGKSQFPVSRVEQTKSIKWRNLQRISFDQEILGASLLNKWRLLGNTGHPFCEAVFEGVYLPSLSHARARDRKVAVWVAGPGDSRKIILFDQDERTEWLYQSFVQGNLMWFSKMRNLWWKKSIAGALTVSSKSLFILVCVSCALCCLDQAMSLSFLPPRPTSWEKRVVFSHLNYVSSCILSARCCLLQRMRQAELESWLVPYCHSKLCNSRSQRRAKEFRILGDSTICFQMLTPWLSLQASGCLFF